jgi:tetratricopeptide (TPR) repeat protein
MLIIALLMAALVPRARAFSFSYHNLITAQASTTTLYDKHDNVYGAVHTDRRNFGTSMASICLASFTLTPSKALAEDAMSTAASSEVQVMATGDVKRLFNEGRAFEAQGNILAAQRLYLKVTNIAPRFIYGWSNLGNTLVAQGQLREADESYSKAVALCQENLKQTEASFGTRRCDDLYLILLNRGSVRLNNNMPKEALSDLTKSDTLRARPDATILQNLVRNVPIKNC